MSAAARTARARGAGGRALRWCYVAAAVATLAAAAGCRRDFDPRVYASNSGALFAASLKELRARHWENAAKGFEQLTRDLPARDTLLPAAYFYLGRAQDRNGDHLLAAQSFTRIADAFPDDTLAADALLAGGLAYAAMWRKPELDPGYGAQALSTLQNLLALYPDSPLVPRATAEIAKIDDKLARKDLATGEHYLGRGAYDSAIIYLKDVIRLHPNAPSTRTAYLRLLEAYRAIRYRDDARDLCDAMRKNYPNDREVRSACGSASLAGASTPRT